MTQRFRHRPFAEKAQAIAAKWAQRPDHHLSAADSATLAQWFESAMVEAADRGPFGLTQSEPHAIIDQLKVSADTVPQTAWMVTASGPREEAGLWRNPGNGRIYTDADFEVERVTVGFALAAPHRTTPMPGRMREDCHALRQGLHLALVNRATDRVVFEGPLVALPRPLRWLQSRCSELQRTWTIPSPLPLTYRWCVTLRVEGRQWYLPTTQR